MRVYTVRKISIWTSVRTLRASRGCSRGEPLRGVVACIRIGPSYITVSQNTTTNTRKRYREGRGVFIEHHSRVPTLVAIKPFSIRIYFNTD